MYRLQHKPFSQSTKGTKILDLQTIISITMKTMAIIYALHTFELVKKKYGETNALHEI